jgi:ketosteroid isomerase-like protein
VSHTQQIARRYYDAWTAGDTNTVATLLSPNFHFAAGDRRIDGREAFLDSGAFPRDATTTVVAEAYQDDVAFQMYDATRGDRTIRVVEQLTVRDGMIASSVFVTDTAALRDVRRRLSATEVAARMNRNPAVDQWLDAADDPMGATMRRARDIILDADGRVTESIKWKTPTFAYKGQHRQLQPVEERHQHHVPPGLRDPGRPSSPRGRRQARPHHALHRPRPARGRPSRPRGRHPRLVRLEGGSVQAELRPVERMARILPAPTMDTADPDDSRVAESPSAIGSDRPIPQSRRRCCVRGDRL